ncbi:MAG: FG-GAP repeat protein [Verrucomicrobia bacterium]|nr:FG-GAP repeat protein [Verrucomicrobiota bacterium]
MMISQQYLPRLVLPVLLTFSAICQLSAQLIPDALTLQGLASGPGPWTEASLAVNANPHFGHAVALHGDTLVVGHHSTGRALHCLSTVKWSLALEQELIPAATQYVNFGWSVDIDGNTIVVGAYGESDFNGGIYIFERNGTTWTQTAGRTATTGSDHFGQSVAVSGDLVVAGHLADTRSRGAVHTFARNQGGSNNWGETSRLIAQDAADNDLFGTSLALAGDTLVVGAPLDDDKGSASGSVYVYTRDADAWALQQKLVVEKGIANERFGWRLAVEGDLLAVGTSRDGFNNDNVLLWRRTAGSWSFTQGLRAPGGSVHSISLSGQTLAVGIPEWYPDGAAYLFTENAGTWGLSKSYFIDPEVYFRVYGSSVAVDEDTFVIGDPGAYRPGTTVQTGTVEVRAVDYANTAVLAGYVRKYLYHQDADNSPAFPKDRAAFRYKDRLYSNEAGSTIPITPAWLDCGGQVELQRSSEAEALLFKFISRNNSPDYGNLLLDLHYDRSAAEIILAKEKVALAEQDRLGPTLGRIPPDSGFVIDNEIERYTEAGDKFLEALKHYFQLFDRGLTLHQPGIPETKLVWANSVIRFSSEYRPEETTWDSIQALGPPDTYPNHGDIVTAWASATADGQREFLELGFPPTSSTTEIRIYETYNPGAVDLVQVRHAVNQTWHTVWTGTAAAAPAESRIFSVKFATPGFDIDGVRIELDSVKVIGWNEIDAVGVVSTVTVPAKEVLSPSFGYDLFRNLVPDRDLGPATVIIEGKPQSVTGDPAVLFTGYRDLVMLYNLLKDYGVNSRQLAWLHWANGDVGASRKLISDSQRSLLVNGSLLDSLFPELDISIESASGLDSAVAGYRASLGDLSALPLRSAATPHPWVSNGTF